MSETYTLDDYTAGFFQLNIGTEAIAHLSLHDTYREGVSDET